MKNLKKALALLLCLLLMASGCMLSVSAADTTTIYFEVPSDWANYHSVFCHITVYGGNSLGNWQAKKERCTQVEGNLYSYDTTKVGGLEEGVIYTVIMSLDTGMETYTTVMTTACYGDTLYCDNTYYENPVDSNKTSRAAFWRNQDAEVYGPLLQITSLGNIVGTCALKPASEIFMDFLLNDFENAQWYSGKTDQQIIDDTISALGIEKDEAAQIIEESGVYVEWFSESFLESIEVKPISFIEGTSGYIDEDYDEEIDYWVEYYRYSDFYDIEYTLTFIDGTVISDTGRWFDYDGMEYDINITTNQSYENQWKAGNTYEATASVLGVSTTFPVTIEKSPIKSIEAKPISLIEGTGGYIDEDYDYDAEEWVEYYRYTDLYDVEYTVTFNDGTTQTETDNYFYYNDTQYRVYFKTNQSYKNQWKAGNTYEATITVTGVSDTFPVTIEKTPIKSIEVKPLSFIVNTNGFFDTDYNEETDEYDLKYYRYNHFNRIEYTVTLNDGTSHSGNGYGFEYNGKCYEIELEYNQSYENQWTAGNTYEVTATILGVTTTFPVTIENSPVKSFSINPFTLTEGIDSYYADAGFEDDIDYYYVYENYDKYVSYTITFNDGTTISGKNTTVEYKGEKYDIELSDDQSYENQWKVGNTYKIKASFMGVTCEPLVTIAENPITSIDVIKQPDKTEFDKNEAINPQGAVLRINYNDGTYDDVTLGMYNPINGNSYVYIKRFNDNFFWSSSYRIDENNHYDVYLLDYQIEVNGKYSDKEIKAATISEKDAQLYIKLTYNDNSQKTVKALGMEIAGRGQESADLYSVGGIIITDDGLYIGSLYKYISTGKFYITLRSFGESSDTITSNTLDSCMWWSLQDKFGSVVYTLAVGAGDLKTYDGTITSKNIDNLLKIACYEQRLFWDDESIIDETSAWITFKAKAVKLAFFELFGVLPDLSLSANYDSIKDSIKIQTFDGYGGESYKRPFEVTYSNGTYTATINWGVSDYTITLDDELTLVAFQIKRNDANILGDVNGDNTVNIKDATAIQKHLAMLTTLSENGILMADVNGDEDVNIKDATTIQKHLAGLIVDSPIGKTFA